MKHLKIFEDFDQDRWQQDYDQLIMDMEEEAEAEGGPIASDYATRMEEMERERDEATRTDVSTPSDGIDELHDKLKTYLNKSQIVNLIDHLEDGRDDHFIQTRLEFYGVAPEDCEMVKTLLNTLKELYG